MGIFDLFRKEPTKSEAPITSNCNSAEEGGKITIPTPKPKQAIFYERKLKGIRAYFGRLYKNAVKGTAERYSFNILHIEKTVAVYFVYTRYTGETKIPFPNINKFVNIEERSLTIEKLLNSL